MITIIIFSKSITALYTVLALLKVFLAVFRHSAKSAGHVFCTEILRSGTVNLPLAYVIDPNHLRSRKTLFVWCFHSAVSGFRVYCGNNFQPSVATIFKASRTNCTSLSDMKNGSEIRTKPGRSISNDECSSCRRRWCRSSLSSSSNMFSYSAASDSSMPNRSWAYGPAHAQPPRACTPKTSLRMAHTKLWCKNAPRG